MNILNSLFHVDNSERGILENFWEEHHEAQALHWFAMFSLKSKYHSFLPIDEQHFQVGKEWSMQHGVFYNGKKPTPRMKVWFCYNCREHQTRYPESLASAIMLQPESCITYPCLTYS